MTRVRAFRRDEDLEGFLSLYEEVSGVRRDGEWFDWKYASGPSVAAPTVVVAVREGPAGGDAGEVIGARPFVPMSLAVGSRRVLAVQPVDAMVHPDHRREGVFTAMTEWALAAFEGSDAALCFNFPNDAAAAGNRKLGWRPVQQLSSYYRFAHPARIAADTEGRALAKAAAAVLSPAASGYNTVRRALAPAPDGDADAMPVRRETTVPVGELAARYRARPPGAIHVVRDAVFYERTLGNPDWRYEAYLAGDDETALLVGRSTRPDRDVLRVTDVLPPADADRSRPALAALLREALRDHADAAMAVAPSLPGANDLLADFGFLCDDDPPLRYVASRTNHYARTLSGDWTVDGVTIDDPENWTLTFVERDTT